MPLLANSNFLAAAAAERKEQGLGSRLRTFLSGENHCGFESADDSAAPAKQDSAAQKVDAAAEKVIVEELEEIAFLSN